MQLQKCVCCAHIGKKLQCKSNIRRRPLAASNLANLTVAAHSLFILWEILNGNLYGGSEEGKYKKKNSTVRASNVTDHVHKYLSFLFLSSSSHSHKHSYRFDRIIICKMHISNFAPNRNRLALLLPHQR